MATVKELIVIECKAEGPKTALEIYNYVNSQSMEYIETDTVAEFMNELMKAGTIEIYDIDEDGIPSFW